jgi:excisionase family DNA binding protein
LLALCWPRETTMRPLTIRIAEFCSLVGLGKTKTYELINSGVLETITIGRRRLITMASAEALIARKKGEPK